MPNAKVDYSTWNAIQSSRHQSHASFMMPAWTLPTLLVVALLVVAALVVKVLTYQPSEHITIETIPIELAPIKVTVSVDGDGGQMAPVVRDVQGNEPQSGVQSSNHSQEGRKEQTPNTPQPDDQKSGSTINCPPIAMPTLTKDTQCQAVRENSSITLTCGEHTITDIPTLVCVFDQVPKGAYRVRN